MSLVNSQEKLRQKIPKIDRCRREIEVLFGLIQGELVPTKEKILQTLDQLREALVNKIEEAHKEINENALTEATSPLFLLLLWYGLTAFSRVLTQSPSLPIKYEWMWRLSSIPRAFPSKLLCLR